MKKPEKPEDEEARLNVLRQLKVLDTEAEERFDRYTRMVKRLLGVPIALVSLVDEDRQWFKSRQGLGAEETSRDVSFCAHAILNDDIMIVEDAVLDERFADNPLVTGDPNIRFYAGCPLRGPGGHKVGTICVIDKEPRTLDEDDIETLRDFSAMVASELMSLGHATTDELTGLSNLQGLTVLSSRIFDSPPDFPSACLVFIDIAGFKQITKVHGDKEGLATVQVFSTLIMESFGEAGLVARESDDTFCVIIPDSVLERPGQLIHKLQNALQLVNEEPGRTTELSFYSAIVKCASFTNLHEAVEEARTQIRQGKSST